MDLKEYAPLSKRRGGWTGYYSHSRICQPDVLGRGTDWQDAIFQTGKVSSHQLRFFNGKDTELFLCQRVKQDGIWSVQILTATPTRFNLDNQIKNGWKWVSAIISPAACRMLRWQMPPKARYGGVRFKVRWYLLKPGWFLGGNQQTGAITYNQDNPVARAELRAINHQHTDVW